MSDSATTTTSTTSSSSTSTTGKPLPASALLRQAFNWQFLNTGEISSDGVDTWSVAQVADWLTRQDLSSLSTTFTQEDVDGQTLLELTDSDLKDLGLSLGNRKKFEKARAFLIETDKTKKNGIILEKGFAPKGPTFTEEQRLKLKNFVYQHTTKTWIKREVPLNNEELECWDEQAQWLCCPISGKTWRDTDSILGVGLYHAPRLMSEKEIQRAVDDEIRATVEKQQKRELETKKDTVTTTPTSTDTITSTTSGVTTDTDRGDRDRDTKEGTGDKKAKEIDENFSKVFQVYPSVVPPPLENLDSSKNSSDAPLGIVDVIVGPAFDARAYNWGRNGHPEKRISSKKERGVLSMDQQYNAFNFVYYILRAKGSYERKICTNRLSFFIDEEHGSRVFPENIESQLSLLVYRDKRLCRGATSFLKEKDRLYLLADAIRKSIPRILRAVIMEVVNGRSSALDERIDHSIRTYLLIHQISIKLVLYYREAYECLYKSIVLWIQNPFAPICEHDWPNLEDVLIGASLVGIPWAIMRESFVKKLMFVAITNAPKFRGTVAQWIEHLFEHNKALFLLVLYEISFFFTSSRPLVEMDKVYSRCAGSLPRAERESIKTTLQRVGEVSTFTEVWVSLGMDHSPDEDVQNERIEAYLKHLSQNAAKWKAQKLPESKIIVPAPEQQMHVDQLKSQGLVLRSELDRQKEEALALERAKHRGFPPLNRTGHLDRRVCNYPLCKKKFKCRDHLFRHLRKVIEPDRMVTGYHVSHIELRVSPNSKSLECGACHEIFTTLPEIQAHYAARGVPSYYGLDSYLLALDTNSALANTIAAASSAAASSNNSNARSTTNANANANANPPSPAKGKAKKTVQEEKQNNGDVDFSDMGSCVICMDKKREAVNIPCGHLICCYDCGLLVKECAMCRVAIRDVIRVYCS